MNEALNILGFLTLSELETLRIALNKEIALKKERKALAKKLLKSK